MDVFSTMLSLNPNYACCALQRFVQLGGTQKGEEYRPQNLVMRPDNEVFGRPSF